MANKNVYQKHDKDALEHFKLENDPTYGVMTSDSNVDDVLITQNEKVFAEIRDILTDETIIGKNIANYKRAFVLPGCTVTLDRIKAAAKEHKVTITNDYEKADFIITHDNYYQKFSNGEKIKSTKLLYRLWNYEAYKYNDLPTNRPCAPIAHYSGNVVYDDKWYDYYAITSYNCSNPVSLMDEWGITGLAINLAYLVDTKELEVLDVSTLLHASSNVTPLDENMVVELTTWCTSYDEDNKSIAAKILPTVDYTKNPHLLWQLAQNIYSYTHSYNRDKDVLYWLQQSELGKLYHFSAQDMILDLEEKEELDKESFRYLEKIVRQEISIHNRDLYVFKVSVKPEYKKYLK